MLPPWLRDDTTEIEPLPIDPVPLETVTEPPISALLAPPDIVTVPAAPLEEPETTCTSPLCDLNDVPEPIDTAPDKDVELRPLTTETSPLAAPDTSASELSTRTEPLA
jgi:hypothetical protein